VDRLPGHQDVAGIMFDEQHLDRGDRGHGVGHEMVSSRGSADATGAGDSTGSTGVSAAAGWTRSAGSGGAAGSASTGEAAGAAGDTDTGTGSAGRVNRIVVPPVTEVSIQIRPPWYSMIFLAMASPMPVPG